MTLDIKLHFNKDEDQIIAFIKSQKVAHINIVDEGKYIWISSVLVYEKYRRKGIATLMYKKAQEIYSKPIRPAEDQTSDARLFWDHIQNEIIVYK